MAFDAGAAFYDALASRPGRLEREGVLLGRLLPEAPAATVMDIGCGTGVHAHYLAGLGAEVVAVDRSAEMIRFASAHRAHPSIAYRVGDMRAVSGEGFGMAICLGNSMALISTEYELRLVFRGVHGCLLPGGCFLVQVVNANAPGSGAIRHRLERVTLSDAMPGEGVVLKTLAPHEGWTLLSLAYFAFNGDETVTHSESAVLRHWGLDSLCVAATSEGLALTETFGSFDGASFAPAESADLIAVFERPPHGA